METRKKNAFQLERKVTKSEMKTAIAARNRERGSFIDELDFTHVPLYKQLNKLVPPTLNPYR